MSLRGSLILGFSVLLTAVALVAAAFSYVTAKSEASDTLDFQQRQIARFIGDGSGIATADPQSLAQEADEDYAIRIDYAEGGPSRMSGQASLLPPSAPEGFSDFTGAQEAWRIFTRKDANRTVLVGQRIAAREETAQDAAIGAAVPFVAAIPLSWLVVYLLVGSIMRRLADIAKTVEARGVADTEPLATANVPEEARPLVDSMNTAFARLRLALEQQRSFLSDAAHELRTPLAALTLQIGNLKTARDKQTLKTRIADAEQGARRAVGLVEQLLRLARQDAPVAEPAVPVVLREVALNAVAALAPAAHAKGVDLGLSESDSASVSGSEPDLRALAEILIDNAVRYTPKGGRVDVAASGGTLAVRDTGPGIPGKLLPHVFDRFFRGDTRAIEGSGLGLAIAKAIAARHGADISLRNREDGTGLVAEVRFLILS